MRDAIEEYYTPICSLDNNPGLPEFPDIIPHPNDVTRLSSIGSVNFPAPNAVQSHTARAVHAPVPAGVA